MPIPANGDNLLRRSINSIERDIRTAEAAVTGRVAGVNNYNGRVIASAGYGPGSSVYPTYQNNLDRSVDSLNTSQKLAITRSRTTEGARSNTAIFRPSFNPNAFETGEQDNTIVIDPTIAPVYLYKGMIEEPEFYDETDPEPKEYLIDICVTFASIFKSQNFIQGSDYFPFLYTRFPTDPNTFDPSNPDYTTELINPGDQVFPSDILVLRVLPGASGERKPLAFSYLFQ
jgi:hypothetical protein